MGDEVRVTGIGGIFFKAGDPQGSASWYRDHLGVNVGGDNDAGSTAAQFLWRERAEPHDPGTTVWALFPEDTSYFGSGSQNFMVNYRVADIRSLLDRLRDEGVWVDDNVEEYEYGIFGWIKDPDGNRIELWEPRGEE